MKTIICFLFVIGMNVFSQTWVDQNASGLTDLKCAWATDTNVVWICGTLGTAARTTNGGATWSIIESGLTGSDINVISAADANTGIAGSSNGQLWRTTNGGAVWSYILMIANNVNIIHMFNANLGFAVGDRSATAGPWNYYITTDGGATWNLGANSPANIVGEHGFVNSYSAIDTGHIWWGTSGSKIYKGSFRGPFTYASTSQPWPMAVAFNDAQTGIAVMTNNFIPQLIGLSSDGGASWPQGSFTPSGTDIQFPLKCIPGSGRWWLGTSQYIYMSTNAGANWTTQLAITQQCFCMTFANINTGWAGTFGGHIYRYYPFSAPAAPLLVSPPNNSTGQGLALDLVWHKSASASTYRVQLATDTSFSNLVVNDSTLTDSLRSVTGLLNSTIYYWRVNAKNIAGVSSWSTMWKFNTLLTGLQNIESGLPKEYKLYNNYPNPFNPSTTIKFALPFDDNVVINVFDITGKEVAELLDQKMTAGAHEIKFESSNLSSGVYFYKITASGFIDMRKMILVK